MIITENLSQSNLREQVSKLVPPDFAPRYPPEAFDQYLQVLTLLPSGRGDNDPQAYFTTSLVQDLPDIRLVHDQVELNLERAEAIASSCPEIGLTPQQILQAPEIYPNLLVFNQQEDHTKEPKPISLNDEANRDLRNLAKEYLRKGPNFIVMGFAGERTSVRGTIEAAADFVGTEKVIVVDAGLDIEATSEAKKAGCKVIDQKKALRTCFDWTKIRNLYGLPFSNDRIPSGKGTSHYIALLYGAATGIFDDKSDVIHKDTDVTNPWIYTPELYMALTRILEPQKDPIYFTQALCTGDGRNNETWLYQANALANAKTLIKAQIGTAVASLGWPLSDSRGGRWEYIKNFHFLQVWAWKQ